MLSLVLYPDQVIHLDGESPGIAIGNAGQSTAEVILIITRTAERESLVLSIWGSADGEIWGEEPLLQFPPKFHCGTHPRPLDLGEHPHVRYLKARWKLSGWGHGLPTLLFGFCVTLRSSAEAGVDVRSHSGKRAGGIPVVDQVRERTGPDRESHSDILVSQSTTAHSGGRR